MKSGVALGAAVAAILLAVAGARAHEEAVPDGVHQYAGRLGDEAGTKIRILIGFRDGNRATVRRVRYRNLDAQCERGEPKTISGRWTFDPPYRVGASRKFTISGHDSGPVGQRSSLRLTGRFSVNFRRLRGEFQSTAFLYEEPQQTCIGATRAYRARRR